MKNQSTIQRDIWQKNKQEKLETYVQGIMYKLNSTSMAGILGHQKSKLP